MTSDSFERLSPALRAGGYSIDAPGAYAPGFTLAVRFADLEHGLMQRSLRSRREHKAWGVSPRIKNKQCREAREAGGSAVARFAAEAVIQSIAP